MKTFLNMGLLMAAAVAPWTSNCLAWEVPLPKASGVKLYVEKQRYESGEAVRFMLYKHTRVSGPTSTFTMYKVTILHDNVGQLTPTTVTAQHDPHLGLVTLGSANLKGSYYIIQQKTDKGWREFFTSKPEPFGTQLENEKGRVWRWNQKDNEGTHRAKSGEWRLVFHAPEYSKGNPWTVRFTIR